MLKRILLPTDGSVAGDVPLELAAAIAQVQGAEVLVAQVVDIPAWWQLEEEPGWNAEPYEEILEGLEQGGQDELDRRTAQLRAADVHASGELLHGPVAHALLDVEQRYQPDLVVMATHGRTGLARFALGSVADRLVREGTAPVLLVRSFGPSVESLSVALVPLDGSEIAEQALPMVEALAAGPINRIRLLRAVKPDKDETAARVYLEGVRHRLEPLNVPIETLISHQEPGEAIASAAVGADLVILATHGRGGMDRLRHGSIANAVVHDTTLPVLLVRARVATADTTPHLPGTVSGAA
jgi:nucleotide-binding universal stress UspA family protein